jgi:hypothetical protein
MQQKTKDYWNTQLWEACERSGKLLDAQEAVSNGADVNVDFLW